MPAPKGHDPYPGCERVGRPKLHTTEFIEKEADAFLEWIQRPDSIWFKDFCLERSLDTDLLSEWAAKNKKFSGIYRLAKGLQESRLVKGGLLSVYNPTLVKFILSNVHGWAEKQETKLTGDKANPLAFLLQQTDGTSKDLVKDDG